MTLTSKCYYKSIKEDELLYYTPMMQTMIQSLINKSLTSVYGAKLCSWKPFISLRAVFFVLVILCQKCDLHKQTQLGHSVHNDTHFNIYGLHIKYIVVDTIKFIIEFDCSVRQIFFVKCIKNFQNICVNHFGLI